MKVLINNTIKKNNNILNVGLAENRHSIPEATDGFIFKEWTPHSENIVSMLHDKAYKKILQIAKRKGFVDIEVNKIKDVHINLYVTGLTVALIAVLNAMSDEDVTITLWHWDKYKKAFYKQDVLK